jgi:hypothetical protein
MKSEQWVGNGPERFPGTVSFHFLGEVQSRGGFEPLPVMFSTGTLSISHIEFDYSRK